MFKIGKSERRDANRPILQVSGDVSIQSTGEITVGRHDLMPASLRIQYKDLVIYTDPVQVENREQADYIFITHNHPDHLSIDDIAALSGPETVIVAAREAAGTIAKKLKSASLSIITAEPGESLDFTDFKCEVVPAYNRKPLFLWFKAHPESAGNAGFIWRFGETAVYHAGDTDALSEIHDRQNLSVLILPIGDGTLTMSAEEAWNLTGLLHPETVIPIHYAMTLTDGVWDGDEDFQTFLSLAESADSDRNSVSLKILHRR